MKLMAQALCHVPPVRMGEMSRRLIGGGEQVSPDEETVSLVHLFSADLALFTAPPGRSSAVERLAKQLRLPPASVEGQALTGLLEARLALFELTGPAESGTLPARDLMSGQPLRLEDESLAARVGVAGRRFAARLVAVGGRGVIAGWRRYSRRHGDAGASPPLADPRRPRLEQPGARRRDALSPCPAPWHGAAGGARCRGRRVSPARDAVALVEPRPMSPSGSLGDYPSCQVVWLWSDPSGSLPYADWPTASLLRGLYNVSP